jgi:hypothetical protein
MKWSLDTPSLHGSLDLRLTPHDINQRMIDYLRAAVASEEGDVRQQHRIGARPGLEPPITPPDYPRGPVEHRPHRGGVHPMSGLDVNHSHAVVRVPQQQIRDVATLRETVEADQLHWLRCNAHNIRIEVRQHDPSQLQPAFVCHQPTRRGRPVPAGVIRAAPCTNGSRAPASRSQHRRPTGDPTWTQPAQRPRSCTAPRSPPQEMS